MGVRGRGSDGPLRIGLLGAARIAEEAILTPAAARDDVCVLAIAARDRSRAAAFAAQHGIAQVEDGYAQLVARDDLDLIYVATPPALHADLAIAALANGKAVLCEKPLAASAVDAARMVEASRRYGLPLIEALHYRFHPLMHRAIALLESGAIGTVEHAEAVFETQIPYGTDEFRWSAVLGGGALLDLGCYAVHALRTLIGMEPELVDASARIVRGIDVASSARLQFGPVGADVRVSFDAVAPAMQISLCGSRGWVRFEQFVTPQRGGRLVVSSGRAERVLMPGALTTFAAQLEAVSSVLREDTPPLTGGVDSIANMACLDAIAAHARSG